MLFFIEGRWRSLSIFFISSLVCVSSKKNDMKYYFPPPPFWLFWLLFFVHFLNQFDADGDRATKKRGVVTTHLWEGKEERVAKLSFVSLSRGNETVKKRDKKKQRKRGKKMSRRATKFSSSSSFSVAPLSLSYSSPLSVASHLARSLLSLSLFALPGRLVRVLFIYFCIIFASRVEQETVLRGVKPRPPPCVVVASFSS